MICNRVTLNTIELDRSGLSGAPGHIFSVFVALAVGGVRPPCASAMHFK
jgi:hypothetical protein